MLICGLSHEPYETLIYDQLLLFSKPFLSNPLLMTMMHVAESYNNIAQLYMQHQLAQARPTMPCISLVPVLSIMTDTVHTAHDASVLIMRW